MLVSLAKAALNMPPRQVFVGRVSFWADSENPKSPGRTNALGKVRTDWHQLRIKRNPVHAGTKYLPTGPASNVTKFNFTWQTSNLEPPDIPPPPNMLRKGGPSGLGCYKLHGIFAGLRFFPCTYSHMAMGQNPNRLAPSEHPNPK